MFARSRQSAFQAPTGSAKPGLRGFADTVLEALKKPYVGPVAAGCLFIAVLMLFLNLASDPEAASPTVRISLARPADPAHAPSQPRNDVTDFEAFSLDGSGGLTDAGLDAFGVATDQPVIITMPGDPHAVTPAPGVRAASPLPSAPIAGLFTTTPQGPVPIISSSGLTPAQAYARPFRSNGKPMVALIVGGLGLNPQTTKQAIELLPPEVTLSFVPYAANLQGWIDMARAAGHEVLIEVPMQPLNYPENDPGPQTLLANARPEDLNQRLGWVMSRATGYFGVTNYQGGAFLRDKDGAQLFMETLRSRGLAFIDDGQARGMTGAKGRATAERIIDNQINAEAITQQLAGLESSAKANGKALGSGFAYPVTLATALKWTQGLDQKGLQLAPASAIAH